MFPAGTAQEFISVPVKFEYVGVHVGQDRVEVDLVAEDRPQPVEPRQMFGNLVIGVNQFVEPVSVFIGNLEKQLDRSPYKAEMRGALTEDIDCRAKFAESLEQWLYAAQIAQAATLFLITLDDLGCRPHI